MVWIINPCIDFCYSRYGKQYSSDCDNKCTYAKAIKCLKEVLIVNDGCHSHCKHSYHEKYVGMICDNEEECKNHSMYELDFEKIYSDYEINQ